MIVSTVVEIVIFDVKKGKEVEFEEGSKTFADFVATQEGYVRRWYFREKLFPGRYIHCTEYKDRDSGQDIIGNYKKVIGVEKFNYFFNLLKRMPKIEWHEIWLP